jgi:hypothetical protein
LDDAPNPLFAIRDPRWRAVSQRKAFLLRVDPALLEAVQRWADDDLRSLNGQIEFLLRQALAEAGRARPAEARHAGAPPDQGASR